MTSIRSSNFSYCLKWLHYIDFAKFLFLFKKLSMEFEHSISLQVDMQFVAPALFFSIPYIASSVHCIYVNSLNNILSLVMKLGRTGWKLRQWAKFRANFTLKR